MMQQKRNVKITKILYSNRFKNQPTAKTNKNKKKSNKMLLIKTISTKTLNLVIKKAAVPR